MTATISKEVELLEIDRSALRGADARWQRAKAILGLLMLGLAYYGFWRIRDIYLSWADNADVLYLAALYRDLVSHHYPLTGWRLTPAPYFFPDMPLFFLSAAVTPNLPSAYCLYGGVMLSAIFGCMYWIARAVSSSRADRLLAVGLAAMLMFLLALRSNSYWIPMRWLLAPSGHSGCLVCGLILVGLALDLPGRLTPIRMIVFALFSFIALVSDQLVLTQFLAPIVVATLITAIINRSRKHLIAGAAVAASSLTAWGIAILALHAFVRGSNFEILPIDARLAPWSLVAHWWPQFKQDWNDVAGPGTPLFIIVLASLSAVVVTLIHLRSIKQRQRSNTSAEAVSFTAWVALASWVLSFVAPLLMAMWGNIDCFRYELSFLVLPLLLLAICLAHALHLLPKAVGTGVGLTACAAGLVLSLPMRNAPAVENANTFYPRYVLAFDQLKREYGLHAGFADYWMSRSVTLLSKEDLLISPLEADDHALAPILWIGNPNHWCQAPDGKPGEYPIYDFAICPPINEARIRRLCGAPAKVVEYNHMRILVYNRPSDVLFRNMCRAVATTVADAPLTSPILKLRFLNHAKLPGHPWFGPETKILRPGQRVELRLQRPIVADVLEITANAGKEYQLQFRLLDQFVGETQLGRAPGHDLQPQDILLAPITGERAFDRIDITAGQEPGFYSIGSVMVFSDLVLHPRQPSKIQRQ